MEYDEDEPFCDPEDCEVCGLPAGDFSDEDWENGSWKCPECGAVQ